jgi:hypothetical protein
MTPEPFLAASISTFFSFSFSPLSSRISLSYALSLMMATLTIFLALSAYLSVPKDSS